MSKPKLPMPPGLDNKNGKLGAGFGAAKPGIIGASGPMQAPFSSKPGMKSQKPNQRQTYKPLESPQPRRWETPGPDTQPYDPNP